MSVLQHDLLTATEVAERLRVSTAFVYREIHAGRLPAVKLGNRYRIREADYQTFITPKPKTTPRPRNQRERIRRLLDEL
ncbi:helix-turn-helix domain-containing protein [Paenarthrobacter nicotinovorans]|uniref:helix-turn-helix domain-containing protein n=1 Tax=Paenarthrobacter nicotinovorans TaxID=29320 RepID=UPI0009A64CC4|nr:helix-turn-helix domain-containing protein [Paenarthrobacter nicotinovorans]